MKKLTILFFCAISVIGCSKKQLTSPVENAGTTKPSNVQSTSTGDENPQGNNDKTKTPVALYTTCAAINSPADYTVTGGSIGVGQSYSMSSNKLLRIKHSGSFNNAKPISFQIADASTQTYAKVYGKGSSGTIFAMTSCANVPAGGTTIISATNVPFGTVEVWLEFYSNGATTVTWTRLPQ